MSEEDVLPSNCLTRELRDEINRRKKHLLYRQRKPVSYVDGVFIHLNNKRLINFSSNDYLLLSQHIEVKKAAKSALDQFGVGATASPLITGYSELHEKLENRFSEFTGFESALVFSSGFQANMAVMSALMSQNSTILLNKTCMHHYWMPPEPAAETGSAICITI